MAGCKYEMKKKIAIKNNNEQNMEKWDIQDKSPSSVGAKC